MDRRLLTEAPSGARPLVPLWATFSRRCAHSPTGEPTTLLAMAGEDGRARLRPSANEKPKFAGDHRQPRTVSHSLPSLGDGSVAAVLLSLLVFAFRSEKSYDARTSGVVVHGRFGVHAGR